MPTRTAFVLTVRKESVSLVRYLSNGVTPEVNFLVRYHSRVVEHTWGQPLTWGCRSNGLCSFWRPRRSEDISVHMPLQWWPQVRGQSHKRSTIIEWYLTRTLTSGVIPFDKYLTRLTYWLESSCSQSCKCLTIVNYEASIIPKDTFQLIQCNWPLVHTGLDLYLQVFELSH